MMAKYHQFKLCLCLLCSLLAFPSLASSQQLEALLEPIFIGKQTQIDNIQIISAKLLSRLYQARQYEPLWSDRYYAGTLLDVLKNADNEGLMKEDYHYPRLMELYSQLSATNWQDEHQSNVFEVLLTDGIITYAVHLSHGKINPSMLDKTWNYDKNHLDFDTILKLLETHIQSQTVADAIAKLTPDVAFYHELKQHLLQYRDLAKHYPFTAIPYSEVIRPGTSHPTLAAIDIRLSELGYPDKPATDNTTIAIYDKTMEDRIRLFQIENNLKVDGVIGSATMAALNTSYTHRVDQIRANLERARWLTGNLKESYLIVNLASYELFLFKDNALSWRTDIIIGKVDTKTPIFKSKLKYLVVNPTWTVPRSIIPEILADLRKDPDYLRKKNFNVVEGSGSPVNIDNIDWYTVNSKNFPYWFVQQPSNSNSLGVVKFMFPNKHAIYLHDTPSKRLFERANRAFSHGCIRVKDPLVLADKLLSGNKNWTPASLSEKVAKGKTENIFLDEPLDIFITYLTAAPKEGKLKFYNDIYQRDPILIKALDLPASDAIQAKDRLINIIE